MFSLWNMVNSLSEAGLHLNLLDRDPFIQLSLHFQISQNCRSESSPSLCSSFEIGLNRISWAYSPETDTAV